MASGGGREGGGGEGGGSSSSKGDGGGGDGRGGGGGNNATARRASSSRRDGADRQELALRPVQPLARCHPKGLHEGSKILPARQGAQQRLGVISKLSVGQQVAVYLHAYTNCRSFGL